MPRPRGRPTIRPNAPASSWIHLRIAPDTLELCRKAARKQCSTLSQWARNHLARMARLEL
jgi:predicted HicB family RNase H-like nuclease